MECLGFLLLVAAVVSLSIAIHAKSKADKVTFALDLLKTELDSLRRELVRLQQRPAATAATAAPESVFSGAPPPPAAPPVVVEPQPIVEVSPRIATPPIPEIQPVCAAEGGGAPLSEPEPTAISPIPPPPIEVRPAYAAEGGGAPLSYEPPPISPPPPIEEPPLPPFQPPPVRPPKPPFDWESLVGVKLFSGIAGVALVLAAVFFLKYSVEHGWLSPTVRAIIGLATGVSLIVICELRIARNYAITANAMHGAGIAILYATLFATHARWHLLPPGAVFALMLVVTAVAVMLSIRRDSVFIALLGLVGGFATPALLSTGENRPIGLFSYLLLLNAGLAWIAFKKRWPALTILSLIFTVLYQWGWAVKFMSAGSLPLAAVIFGVFAAMSASALWISRRTLADEEGKKRSLFDRVGVAGAILPLFFALFTAAVPAYGERVNVLFGFLLLMVAGLAAVAITRGPEWLHAVGAVATLLTFAIWSAVSYTPLAWPIIVAWIAVFVVLHLAVGTRLRSAATNAAGLLFAMFPILLFAEPRAASPGLLFGSMFVLLVLVAAFAIRWERGSVFYIAAFFAILAEGVWSAKHLTEARLLQGLAIYGAFALLLVGVPVIARRFGRALPAGGFAMTAILSLAVMFFLTFDRVADASLWGLALMLAIILAGTFAEARAARQPMLIGIVILLSWAVLASWWEGASLVGAVLPALAVVALLGIIAVVGSAWPARDDSQFSGGVFLGLVGHLFLMFVAARADLAIPPWPMLAVLLVLDLAVAIAALRLRNAMLLLAAMALSQVVLAIFATNAELATWAQVAMASALLVAAFACAFFALAHRRFEDEQLREEFGHAALIALILGPIVAVVAGQNVQPPLFGALLLTHVIFAIALLAVAWITGTHAIALVAVAVSALGTALSRADTFGERMAFALVPYALFTAYPLLLGRRAQRAVTPYIAAVLSAVATFFFAYDAMKDAGYGPIIGILPVAQAFVLLALLVRALRIELPGERNLTRLALIAGAALGFITLAIPLQLDKEWITVGWALEGAALAWLFTRIPHRGLLAFSGALLAAVFVRLVFNPAVFGYHPVAHAAIFNWYLYTYLICAAAFFIAAYFYPREFSKARGAANACGAILLFFLLNIEIADFFSTGSTLTFNFTASLAQDLTYTIGWGVFAIGMLIAGIAFHSRPARVAALVLLLVTVLKCFLHDLNRLGGLYRIGSLLGLAISLVLVGVLLQKFVMVKTIPPPEEQPS
jgi:hypothetical protein